MAKMRLGDLLQEKGLINETQMSIALAQQKVTGDLLGNTVTKLGFVSSREISELLAGQAGKNFVDINNFVADEEALRAVPRDIAEKSGLIPINFENGTLHIGINNPTNIAAIDVVTRLTKQTPKVSVVDGEIIGDVTENAYFFLENPVKKQVREIVDEIKSSGNASGPSITKLTDLMIMDAIRRHTTDIHFNPEEDVLHVMYRIDGVLQYGHCLPSLAQTGIVSRIKILSKLDIAEQRLPQDGAFTYTSLKKHYDMRVSTAPSLYGENVVIRILATAGSLPSLGKLGFSSSDGKKIKNLFAKPYGVILIIGPTGSGKTTTLYAALREVDILEKNVLTVEDPIEYRLSFVKQTQVNEKAGYDFALAGRNFMRQDPDVMLLGEIRDDTTATIAIRASITGHLVLSTLHANDTITAIPRLLDLNVDKFLLSTALSGFIAQRLVRRICDYCKTTRNLYDEEIPVFKEYGLEVAEAHYGKGCPKCGGMGYSGRIVIGEVLLIDDEIRELIYTSASMNTIKTAALKKGMRTFKDDALRKAAAGITSVREVLRVAG